MRREGPLLILALSVCSACGTEREAPAPQPCEYRIAPITEGFGAPGPYAVESTVIANAKWPDQHIELFVPRGFDGSVPVLLLAHAFNEDDPRTYRALIEHLVSRGSAVVFPTYSVGKGHAERLDVLWSALEATLASPSSPPLDPGRLGFIGHSYGAGATPALALRALARDGWGKEGVFLALLAPWFAIALEPGALDTFPRHAVALILVFEDDTANDHRIAIDLYDRLGMRDEAKDYVLVRSDRNAGCEIPAVHTLPMSTGLRARDDALDAYALFRLLDALVGHAFDGDQGAARVALGHGAPEQVEMGRWADGTPMRPLVSGGDPEPAQDPSFYLFRADQRGEWLDYERVR